MEIIEAYRSILRPLANSYPMWTPHAESCNSAHSLYACLVNMKVREPSNPSTNKREMIAVPMLILQLGGVLRVKHRGETVDFAWGHTGQHSLQWAAFYGDCEHEVLEVTQGHRITLTYNLYYTSIGKLAQPVSDPHHLPLYDIAREMLLQQKFMRRGESPISTAEMISR